MAPPVSAATRDRRALNFLLGLSFALLAGSFLILALS